MTPLCGARIEHVLGSPACLVRQCEGRPDWWHCVPNGCENPKALRRRPGGTAPDPDAVYLFGALASRLYLRVLRALPALARSWFNTLDRGEATVAKRVTASRYTPLLVAHEMQHARGASDEADPERALAVTAASAQGEITARYERGEIRLSLRVRLPAAYPLVPAAVLVTDRSGVREGHTRRWQLNAQSLLLAQNSSMLDAIAGWKRDVDRHFEGVEECPICYAIVHTATQSLPRMGCVVCHNKFHSACLYKWFHSSGHTKCPMCRNLF